MEHTAKTILIVDDEEDIQDLVDYNLAREGYHVIRAASGEEGIQKTRSALPGLILLDLMLPGMDGLEVCKCLKGDPRTDAIPIIMLTAKQEEADVVIGLELGADDYMTKPFSPRVLIARVKAVLRRPARGNPVKDGPLTIRDLTIDTAKHTIRAGDKPIHATHSEFRLLSFLSRRPGFVFTRYQIVDALRGADYNVTDRSIDVLIAGLRKKLGPAGKNIETVRGVGYRFRE